MRLESWEGQAPAFGKIIIGDRKVTLDWSKVSILLLCLFDEIDKCFVFVRTSHAREETCCVELSRQEDLAALRHLLSDAFAGGGIMVANSTGIWQQLKESKS